MVNDASRATELEFAKRKARLKAQIMKDMVNDEEEGDRGDLRKIAWNFSSCGGSVLRR